MRDELHKKVVPVNTQKGLWWVFFWRWPSIIRECVSEIGQLDKDLSVVRSTYRSEQARCEALQKIAEEMRQSASLAADRAASEKAVSETLSSELDNSKIKLQKNIETITSIEVRISKMELESERLKAELSKTQSDLTRSGLELDKETRHHQETRLDNRLLRELVHRLNRLDIPTRRGIRSLLANGKRLAIFLSLLIPMCVSAQFPPPFWRNAWTTNVPPRAVTGADNLSVTNLGSGTNWLFYEVGPNTIARLMDVSNIVGVATGDAGGTNARQFGTLVLTNLSGTGAVTNIVSLSTTNSTSKPLTNSYSNGIITLFGLEQGTNIVMYMNSSNIVINATGTGGGSDAGGTNIIHTNVVWVSKNGSDSTGTPSDFAKPFLTISNAVQAAVQPAVVRVAPGLYNESIILRNGINLEMSSGVIVSQSVNGLAILFDDGSPVTNSIIGSASLIHTGSGINTANGIKLTSSSTIYINRMDITAVGGNGINIQAPGESPMLIYRGNVFSGEGGIIVNQGSVDFAGQVFGTNDYGCRVSGNGSSNYLSGLFYSELNSAIHVGGGYALIDQAICVSIDNSFGWGVEQSGGAATVRNSVLQPSKQEAIGKYGGTLMVVDGCELYGGTNSTYSIDNDGTGSHGSLIIIGTYANKTANPAMNIIAGGLQVSNVFQSKQSFIISGSTRTNMIFDTNGEVAAFGIFHITNRPGTDRSVRLWNTNGLGYSEFGVVTQAWVPTNKFLFSVTNPVAGEVLGILNVSYANGVASITITNAPDNTGGGGGLTTNANQFLGVPLSIKSGAFQTNMNFWGDGTNNGSVWFDGGLFPLGGDVIGETNVPWKNIVGLKFTVVETGGGTDSIGITAPSLATDYSLILPNAQGANGTVITNNGSGTLGWWDAPSVISQRQGGNAVLSNLVGTVGRNVTNVVSLSTTNATSKPLTNSYISGVLTLFGLEAGTGTTVTPNASNLVIATTVTGAATNANQFGASTTLTLKDGLLTTNLNNFSALSVTNAPGLDRELRLWNTNGGGYTDFSPPTNAWLPTNKLTFSITNPSAGQVLKFQAVSFASGVASITVTNDSDNNPTLTTNANQFSGVPLSIKDGALFTNLNNFNILSITNQPGSDRGIRLWHTNGQAYTELGIPTNQWLPTNKLFLTITNPVANQVLKFQNVSYANGVASIVLTNDSDSAGTGTNMLIQTNGTDLGIAGTVNWTTGVTGYIAGVVANLGVTASGSGGGTNFDSIIITNQVLYQKQHFKSAGSGANTNQIDFTLATHKGFTNALTTNIVCQLTNMTVGASCLLSIYGADGAVIASNYTVKVTGATNLFWLTTTNGNVDFIVTSNKVGLLSLFVDRSTNVFASWREQVP